MVREISEILGAIPWARAVALTFLMLARIGPVVFITPFLGGPRLPATVRTVVAGVLVLAMWPSAWVVSGDLEGSGGFLMLLVVKEGLVGMILAIMAGILFVAIEAGGRIIDLTRGAQNAQVFTGQSTDPSSPVGALFLLFAIVTFMALGGHLMVISALEKSYDVIPLAGWPRAAAWTGAARLAVYVGSEFFLVAVGLAAPVIATAFILEISLGLAGRLAPQMPAYFIGLPLKAWGAILIVFLFLPWMLAWSKSVFESSINLFVHAMQALGA